MSPEALLRAALALERRRAGGPPFRLELDTAFRPGINVVFGPSGSGKTTLLLALLGALRPDRGSIRLGDHILFDSSEGVDLPPHRRGVGVVFQDALLFPHLSVAGNVRFAVQARGAARREEQVRKHLADVGAADWSATPPASLSGGQRQRVALARALAARPRALLLDEPFSALDAPARLELGGLLRRLARERSIPFIHVTHDLPEAARLADRLYVLHEGRLAQEGHPLEVFRSPGSPEVAKLLGGGNFYEARVLEAVPGAGLARVDLGGTVVETGPLACPPGGRVTLALRPEDVLLAAEPIARTSARNVLHGTVRSLERLAQWVEAEVTTPVPIRVRLTPASAEALGLTPGGRIWVVVKAHAFRPLDGALPPSGA